MQHRPDRRITLAITGASGAPYGLRLLQCLLAAQRTVHLMISKPAQVVIDMETDLRLPGRAREIQRYLAEHYAADPQQLRVFGREEWTAPAASGSGAPRSMAICPCSSATLAALAQGASRNLIERAADVVLKERGRLLLVPRETPLSLIHIENMRRLTLAGAVLLPASPGFYHRPDSVDGLVDFVVARILDQLEVTHDLLPAWGTATPGDLAEES